LLSVGLRPINNIVDITNFVMMETGQPLHAFDFDRLEEQRIVVRTARDGEPFTTLDGKERRLSNDMLMICDGKKPVAIGGVMGGLNSEIKESTGSVLIEGAYFSPPSIRRTAKRLALGTDASHRFERGVDPDNTVNAIDRAAQFVAEIEGSRLIRGVIDENYLKPASRKIPLSAAGTNRFLGTQLTVDTVQQLLESIEFSVQRNDSDVLEVSPPSFRVDIGRQVDLMEEVARLSGYNNIPSTIPSIAVGTKLPHRELDIREKIKRLMVGLGYMEVINYSFMNKNWCDHLRLPPDDSRRRLVEILNPLTEDQTVLRSTLIPGILATMHRNVTQQVRNLRFFETGKIFIDKGRDKLPEETEMLSGLWTGTKLTAHWQSKPVPCDYYDIKGTVGSLIRALKVPNPVYSQIPAELCYYMRSGYAAEITIAGDSIGRIGEIDTDALRSFEIKQPTFMFELNLQKLSGHIPVTYKAAPLSKFPATDRDITIIVDSGVETGRIIDKLEDFREELVESIHVFDVFEGDPIPDGKKSVSFRITYRSMNETLHDEAVNRIHKELTQRLVTFFNAALPV